MVRPRAVPEYQHTDARSAREQVLPNNTPVDCIQLRLSSKLYINLQSMLTNLDTLAVLCLRLISYWDMTYTQGDLSLLGP